MSKLYYIPLEIGPWLQDTACIDMDTQGCLLNILFKLWDSKDKGRLCFAFDQLSILLKRSPEECRKVIEKIEKNTLLNVQFQSDGSVLLESRKMIRDAHNSQIKSENGRKGGRPKKEDKPKQKQKESKTKANSDSIYNSDSHSDSTIRKGGTGGKPTDLIPSDWPKDEFSELWAEFKQMRDKKKKPLVNGTVKRCIGALVKASGGKWSIAEECMKRTIDSGWASFFPLKDNYTSGVTYEEQEAEFDKPFGRL